MKHPLKIGSALAFALGMTSGADAAIAPQVMDSGGIKSIVRAPNAAAPAIPGASAQGEEKLLQFAGNSSSNSSSNGSSNSNSNSSSNSSSNSNSNSSANSSSSQLDDGRRGSRSNRSTRNLFDLLLQH